MRAVPERGKICIFNRSHYEDVLVVRVHPEYVRNANISEQLWESRFADINAFEKHLAQNGTVIRKFFLHVSKKEQRERFLERLTNPEKLWKFSVGDVEERRHWEAYEKAYEAMLSATSTDYAPWYVIPADRKWSARALVADVITTAIKDLNLKYPEVSAAQQELYARAKEQLEAE